MSARDSDDDIELEGLLSDREDDEDDEEVIKFAGPKALEITYTSLSKTRQRFESICLKLGLVLSVIVILGVLLFFLFQGKAEPDDILQYIGPLIGTGPGGHVFAGATLPFGMAKPVADLEQGENQAGFASLRNKINGFSSLHDSGSGGLASMGNFPLFVIPDCADVQKCKMGKLSRGVDYVNTSVEASPGYFAITLENGLRAEMTASERTALFRFSFESNITVKSPMFLMDGSDLLSGSGARSLEIDAESRRITAEGTFRPSFGEGTYSAYQCVDLRAPALESYGVFNRTAYPEVRNTTEGVSGMYYDNQQGVYARFGNATNNDEIVVRVGLSWLSTERACQNAEREVPEFGFQPLVENARRLWQEKLAPITIDSRGVDKQHLRNFWSGAYRAFLSPQDYTGENQLWSSTEPYYDSWYCIWDTFRGVHPLYMLIDTVSQSRMVRSLVDIYEHAGWMPDCRMSFCKGFTQGGSNADVVVVDSYLKSLTGVDWTKAYAAVVKDAEVQPPKWDVEGRGGLDSWKTKGYIPYMDADTGGLPTRSISRTVEYAYNDFCIAEMANVTGRSEDYKKYAARASNWKNVYDPDHESMGFRGFPQPRWANGTFDYQNATLCSPIDNPNGCYLDRGGHETYEGSPWLYLFYVPGDMQGLIDLLGGRQAYLDRLETLHNSGVLYMGDEQAFLTAFLYHYAGRPGLSAKKTHQYIPSMFNDTISGIPGNDDSGAMGTFVLFSMLGVFPSAGQNVYLIIPPYFSSVSITNPQTGKTATIRNVNFDPEYKRIYVQKARLDGKTYTKNWIDHSFFLQGGTLELVLGDKESSWGTAEEDVPPSLSTGLFLG